MGLIARCRFERRCGGSAWWRSGQAATRFSICLFLRSRIVRARTACFPAVLVSCCWVNRDPIADACSFLLLWDVVILPADWRKASGEKLKAGCWCWGWPHVRLKVLAPCSCRPINLCLVRILRSLLATTESCDCNARALEMETWQSKINKVKTAVRDVTQSAKKAPDILIAEWPTPSSGLTLPRFLMFTTSTTFFLNAVVRVQRLKIQRLKVQTLNSVK